MKKKCYPAHAAGVLLLLFLGITIMDGCKKEQSGAPVANPDSNVLRYLKSLGYKDNQITDIGTDYVVGGDMAYPKNAVIDTVEKPKHQVDQTGDGTYVTATVSVVIQVDASMNGFLNEINGAIAQWNSVPTRLTFSVYNGTGPAPNVTITNVNLGNGFCGLANAPLNGQPGALVRINTGWISQYSFIQRQQVITHELGHIIGFRHTNWQALGEPQNGADPIGTAVTAVLIPGTSTDAGSIMNGSACNAAPIGLSLFDQNAFQFLYSAPVYVRTEFSNESVTSYDHYGFRDGTYFVDGTIDETSADINIKFYGDFACTHPLTLAAPLNIIVTTSSTHGPANASTYHVGAGVNSYYITNTIVDVVTNLSDTYDDNQFRWDVTGNAGTYTPEPARR